MRCSCCGTGNTRVVATTTHSAGGEIRRRRQCQNCGHRFTTIERVPVELPIVVKDGVPLRREPFSRDKLKQGIELACAKRPVSQAAIERLVEGIESYLEENNIGEVSSRTIGQRVIDGLRTLDEVAYLRYAIVFLNLEDLASVRCEIDRLLA
ncbi:MAG: transcriptional repressor NrdR [Anaerolineae bacterium]|nr:transcriptional repressor NrdR [Anaerolineae bacterium]